MGKDEILMYKSGILTMFKKMSTACQIMSIESYFLVPQKNKNVMIYKDHITIACNKIYNHFLLVSRYKQNLIFLPCRKKPKTLYSRQQGNLRNQILRNNYTKHGIFLIRKILLHPTQNIVWVRNLTVPEQNSEPFCLEIYLLCIG